MIFTSVTNLITSSVAVLLSASAGGFINHPAEVKLNNTMDIWDEIIKQFDVEINKLQSDLGNGSAQDYPHYRQIVGSISGLEWAKQNLKSIVKNRLYEEE